MPVELPGAGGFVQPGVDIAVRSVTASSVGPNAPLLADGVTATPAGWGYAEEVVTKKDPYHGLAWGVKSDGQFISDGVMNGTTAVLTSVSGLFKSADVGKLCLVPKAGPASALLTTTIASYQSATQVTLAAVSQTAVSAAMVTWGTEDTAAWIALYTAAPAGAKVIIPWGYSLYRGNFMAASGITKSLSLEGLGISEIWGSVIIEDMPTQSPYIAGSVIVQCAAATDGIAVTGHHVVLHRRNFGIKFADGIKFLNTGHGFSYISTQMSGAGHVVAQMGSRSDNIVVFGHDGNHYAHYDINSMVITDSHFRSYGGGIFWLECDSYDTLTGDAVWTAPYGILCCPGTAHGYALKARTNTIPGNLNLLCFIRPQCNVEDRSPGNPSGYTSFPELTAPTVSQYIWRNIGSIRLTSIIAPDLEPIAGIYLVDFGGVAAFGVTVINPATVPAGTIFPNQLGAASGLGFTSAGKFSVPGELAVNGGPVTVTDGANGTIASAGTGGDLNLNGARDVYLNPAAGRYAFVGVSGGRVGFYGTAGPTKPAVTGSRGANTALASLLTQLAALGLITDSSS